VIARLGRLPLPIADATAVYHELVEQFQERGEPTRVCFRDLVSGINSTERATHLLHSYPAKLLPHIPAFFLANDELSRAGDTVLDPFCGSGTVLLESIIHGRHAIGVDTNPLACLIASAKISKCSPQLITESLDAVLVPTRKALSSPVPNVCNLEYWFYPHVIAQLNALRLAIFQVKAMDARHFLLACYSACLKKVSLADPRLSVPVRLRHNQYPSGHSFREKTNARMRQLRKQNVYGLFESVVRENVERLRTAQALCPLGIAARVIDADARSLGEKSHGPVDLVITSPPYIGAQKYIRASSFSIGWLSLGGGQSLRELEDLNIGREHFRKSALSSLPISSIDDADELLADIRAINATRAHIAATYLCEMKVAMREVCSILKPGGYFVLVAANNRICGREFETQRYLASMLQGLGLKLRLSVVDNIRSRGLMTRRHWTADVIHREWIHVLQKPYGSSACQT
jgi:SAM-dependent methyltransferase